MVRSDNFPDRMTAIYRLYDAADRLLYVGIGYDFRARWKAHAKKDWWPQVVRKDVIWYDNRLTAAWEETKAILNESPVHNAHPGLELLSLILFRPRDLTDRWGVWHESEMATSTWRQDEIIRDGRQHALVAVEDNVVGVMVPWTWYKKACAAMGQDAGLEELEAESAALWEAERSRELEAAI